MLGEMANKRLLDQNVAIQYVSHTVYVDSVWELTFLILTHHLFSNARVSILVCKDLV